MKKSILNIGKVLDNAEQKQIKGGRGSKGNPFCVEYVTCDTDDNCCPWQVCTPFSNNEGICN